MVRVCLKGSVVDVELELVDAELLVVETVDDGDEDEEVEDTADVEDIDAELLLETGGVEEEIETVLEDDDAVLVVVFVLAVPM
jgi:hypothetical protein